MFILESERLILRPPRPSDVPAMAAWLSDYAVSKNTSRVPHPYSEADAEAFMALPRGGNHVFAIQRRSDGIFLGCCGLHPAEDYEMGYWLGKPFWGQGYATEAAHRVALFAFEELGQQSVHAGWFFDNPASGHVLAKLGAHHNGTGLRESRARGVKVLCHDMLLTREEFLRKQAA